MHISLLKKLIHLFCSNFRQLSRTQGLKFNHLILTVALVFGCGKSFEETLSIEKAQRIKSEAFLTSVQTQNHPFGVVAFPLDSGPAELIDSTQIDCQNTSQCRTNRSLSLTTREDSLRLGLQFRLPTDWSEVHSKGYFSIKIENQPSLRPDAKLANIQKDSIEAINTYRRPSPTYLIRLPQLDEMQKITPSKGPDLYQFELTYWSPSGERIGELSFQIHLIEVFLNIQSKMLEPEIHGSAIRYAESEFSNHNGGKTRIFFQSEPAQVPALKMAWISKLHVQPGLLYESTMQTLFPDSITSSGCQRPEQVQYLNLRHDSLSPRVWTTLRKKDETPKPYSNVHPQTLLSLAIGEGWIFDYWTEKPEVADLLNSPDEASQPEIGWGPLYPAQNGSWICRTRFTLKNLRTLVFPVLVDSSEQSKITPFSPQSGLKVSVLGYESVRYPGFRWIYKTKTGEVI